MDCTRLVACQHRLSSVHFISIKIYCDASKIWSHVRSWTHSMWAIISSEPLKISVCFICLLSDWLVINSRTAHNKRKFKNQIQCLKSHCIAILAEYIHVETLTSNRNHSPNRSYVVMGRPYCFTPVVSSSFFFFSSAYHRTNLLGYIFAPKACIASGENLLNSNICSTCPHNTPLWTSAH